MLLDIFLDLERHLACGPVAAARTLGMSQANYMQQRNGSRRLMQYTRRHIGALLKLTPDQIQSLREEHEPRG